MRLRDNAGLYHALKAGHPVLPIFIFDTEILDDLEDRKDARVTFIHQTMSALKRLDNEIDKIEKQEVEQRSFTDYNSFFQYFLFFGILLIILEFFISNVSDKKSNWKRLIGVK